MDERYQQADVDEWTRPGGNRDAGEIARLRRELAEARAAWGRLCEWIFADRALTTARWSEPTDPAQIAAAHQRYNAAEIALTDADLAGPPREDA